MNLSPAYDQWLETTLSHGREEGRGETKITIALQLLKKNMSLADIAECTGLSIETVTALQQK